MYATVDQVSRREWKRGFQPVRLVRDVDTFQWADKAELELREEQEEADRYDRMLDGLLELTGN